METGSRFEGPMVAIVTPFAEGRVDASALRALVDVLIAEGVTGLIACGTTGESATLSDEERQGVIGVVAEQAGGRALVVGGVGSNDTRVAIEQGRQNVAAGADALLVLAPPYNKPNQRGLAAHFTAVADAIDAPQLVYNVPGRTGCRVEVETLAALSRHPRVVGTKDATADMVFASETLAACEEGFRVLSGDDATLLPFLAVGGHGAISVVGNLAPRLLSDLCAACREERWASARDLHRRRFVPLSRLLFSDSNPIPVKEALALRGVMRNELRLPMVPMEEAGRARLRARLEALEQL